MAEVKESCRAPNKISGRFKLLDTPSQFTRELGPGHEMTAAYKSDVPQAKDAPFLEPEDKEDALRFLAPEPFLDAEEKEPIERTPLNSKACLFVPGTIQAKRWQGLLSLSTYYWSSKAQFWNPAMAIVTQPPSDDDELVVISESEDNEGRQSRVAAQIAMKWQ